MHTWHEPDHHGDFDKRLPPTPSEPEHVATVGVTSEALVVPPASVIPVRAVALPLVRVPVPGGEAHVGQVHLIHGLVQPLDGSGRRQAVPWGNQWASQGGRQRGMQGGHLHNGWTMGNGRRIIRKGRKTFAQRKDNREWKKDNKERKKDIHTTEGQ